MAKTTAPKIVLDLRVSVERARQIERSLAAAHVHAPDEQTRRESGALLGWLRGRIAARTGLLK